MDDFVDVLKDLSARQPELVNELMLQCKDIDDLRAEAGRINLDYENNEPEAVKVL